jgi:uncharacterized protein YjbI with pentapeptide repeats
MEKSLRQCGYFKNFYDHRSKKDITFQCDESVLDESNLCIFHDPSKYKNEADLVNKIIAKIKRSKDESKPLFLVGYNFPSIKLKITLPSPMYFVGSTFHDKVDFTNSEFGFVDFSSCIFEGNADFSHCVFNDMVIIREGMFKEIKLEHCKFFGYWEVNRVTFSRILADHSDFNGEVYFYGSDIKILFMQDCNFFDNCGFYSSGIEFAHFTNTVFNKPENMDSQSKVNFSSTKLSSGDFQRVRFYAEADFNHCEFKQWSFPGTKFFAQSNFLSSKFYNSDFSSCEFYGKSSFFGSNIRHVGL